MSGIGVLIFSTFITEKSCELVSDNTVASSLTICHITRKHKERTVNPPAVSGTFTGEP